MKKLFTLALVGVCLVCLWLSVLACSPKVAVQSSQPATFKVHFHGTSMYPTILNDQMGVMQPYATGEELLRGQIIDFLAPPEKGTYYCKRIIALPYDIITVDNSTIRLNGMRLFERYVVNQGNPSPYQHILALVPPGNVFVLGDNRLVSYDSRFWGFVPISSIVGHLVSLYASPGRQPVPVPDESSVFALAATKHLKGGFFTEWSGYYLTGNAVLFLFLPASFPVCCATRSRKKTLKREDRGLL
jgi:signal peptidase I